MHMAKEAKKHKLGPLHPAYNLLQLVQDCLLGSLPEDAHIRASGKLCVSLTRVSDGRNLLVSQFSSRDDLIQACNLFLFGFYWCHIVVFLHCLMFLLKNLIFFRHLYAAALFLSTVVLFHLHTRELWVNQQHWIYSISNALYHHTFYYIFISCLILEGGFISFWWNDLLTKKKTLLERSGLIHLNSLHKILFYCDELVFFLYATFEFKPQALTNLERVFLSIQHYVDGAVSDNLPRCDQGNTITISPYAGESDLCPRATTLTFHEVRFNNVSIQVNSENLYRVTSTFFPPDPEVGDRWIMFVLQDTAQTRWPYSETYGSNKKVY